MRRIIVAISGVAQAGKDTLAQPLIKQGFQHGSFATNLKEMCQQVFHLSPVLTDTQDGKKKRLEIPRRLTNEALKEIIRWMGKTHDMSHKAQAIEAIREKYIIEPTVKTGKTTEFNTARELLQLVGTDICREIIPTYHIDVLISKISNSPSTNWTITDARFANERDALRSLGALTVLIKRPGLVSEVPAHISESSLGNDDEYDVVVINNSTIEALQEQAKVFTKL